ncbi:MAG: hypothetical protein IJL98_04885 [Lachnospiraceae bacterium]|nr:hypothetical protein [Lachnospiraceae bacterium]
MTTEERVKSLHARMDALKRRREKRKTGLTGAACAVLTLCLVWLIFDGGAAHAGGPAGLYSGATMLLENAGGYVLAAVAAFTAGVVITVLLIKKTRKKEQLMESDPDLRQSEEREQLAESNPDLRQSEERERQTESNPNLRQSEEKEHENKEN